MKLFPTTRNRERQAFPILVAGLCILLILILGVVQSSHIHNGAEATSPGCTLCAVAHLAALPVPALSPAISIQLTFLIQQPVAAHAPPRFLPSALSIRPPPVLTPLS